MICHRLTLPPHACPAHRPHLQPMVDRPAIMLPVITLQRPAQDQQHAASARPVKQLAVLTRPPALHVQG
jgi:hypothetical protein